MTLTIPNGAHLPTLREQAHEAFARLQRTRWMNRHVFGFIRGSEVKTGDDGHWNFHMHFLVIFWHPRMDYRDLSDHWTAALGGKRDGDRNYTVDVESLEAKAWERHDGKEGNLGRRNLVRAARYISKYLCKGEELANLKKGPGGLAHLVASTRHMRRAAFGGGCSVLRRTAAVLMPKQLHMAEEALAEEALAEAPLHEGRMPVRVEVMDADSGEVVDLDPTSRDDDRTRALRAWGEILETNPEPRKGWKLPARVVGVPCGPGGRHRRIGAVPLASAQPTVKAFEAWKADGARPSPLTGMRAVLADGDWRVFRWERLSKKTGKRLSYAAVLPAQRYSWRAVLAAIWAQLPNDLWAPSRRKAHMAHAREVIGYTELEDARLAIADGLSKSETAATLYRARWTSDLREARWQADAGGGALARDRVKRLELSLSELGPMPGLPAPIPFQVNLL